MNRISSFLLVVFAAACTTPPAPGLPAAPDTCRANDHRAFIGQHISAVTLPQGVRWIGPDTLQTYDYVPSRLNVQLNAGGTITDVYCG